MRSSNLQLRTQPCSAVFNRLSVSYDECNVQHAAPTGTLMRIAFGPGENSVRADSGLQIHVSVPQAIGDPLAEVWRVEGHIDCGVQSGVSFACGENLIAAGLVVPEDADIAQCAMQAYQRVIGFCRDRGYPHLYRMWNFFPRINETEGSLGIERYRAFCAGRHQAFAGKPDFEFYLPSASALGCAGQGLLVYFLAGKMPGFQIENPRQTSAFRYPMRYGPKSPSFSRAMAVADGRGKGLFISGTASIRGHESVHPDDVEAQLRETLENLQCLVTHAYQREATPVNDIRRLNQLKIYVRHAEHAQDVLDLLDRQIRPLPPCVVLQADICRAIEGLHLA